MKQFLLVLFISMLLSSCNSRPIKDTELHSLVMLVTGNFSNEEQAKNDPSFAHLNLINILIWEDQPGYWVYSELFDKNSDNIYGQRILHYERVDSSTFVSTSYRLLNSKDYLGGWKDKRIFSKLTLDSLEIREGCQVYFEKNTSTIYSGKTNKNSCTSSIDYIEYITSNFVISKDKISIWNRGYDKAGKQVWGKIKGPYKYKRIYDK